jgi:hypothetical protein
MKRLLVLVLWMFATPFYGQNAAELIRKSIDAVSFDASEMRAVLRIYDNRGNQRERELNNATIKSGSTIMMLMRFISPPDVRGTSFLVHDHEDKSADMWIYLPATKKTRRIAGRQLSSSFMGSEFSNANMSTPNLEDYRHSILGTSKINNRECWKVESICKTPSIARDLGYDRQVSFIDKETNLSYKSEYYDASGNLLKTQTLDNYRPQKNGKYFSFLMEMKNERNGRRSVIETLEFRSGSSLSEKDFTVMALER